MGTRNYKRIYTRKNYIPITIENSDIELLGVIIGLDHNWLEMIIPLIPDNITTALIVNSC